MLSVNEFFHRSMSIGKNYFDMLESYYARDYAKEVEHFKVFKSRILDLVDRLDLEEEDPEVYMRVVERLEELEDLLNRGLYGAVEHFTKEFWETWIEAMYRYSLLTHRTWEELSKVR